MKKAEMKDTAKQILFAQACVVIEAYEGKYEFEEHLTAKASFNGMVKIAVEAGLLTEKEISDIKREAKMAR